jgi:hypothetical protein
MTHKITTDWVSEFAPKTLQKALSYIIGMITRMD